MTKQNPPATAAETPPVTTAEGQGAENPPANDPDGNPPSNETPAAPGPKLSELNHLTNMIGMHNHTGLRDALVGELRGLYGATIVESEDEGVTVEILGIRTDPSDMMQTALTNWANAARRVILEGANQGAGA